MTTLAKELKRRVTLGLQGSGAQAYFWCIRHLTPYFPIIHVGRQIILQQVGRQSRVQTAQRINHC